MLRQRSEAKVSKFFFQPKQKMTERHTEKQSESFFQFLYKKR